MIISDEIETLFERWLIETYPDEIMNKDDLIDKVCTGYRYEEFVELVRKAF